MTMQQGNTSTARRVRTWLGGFKRRLLGRKVTHTVAATKVEAMYAHNPDPWGLASATNDYEHEKYSDTIAQLPRPNYARGLEVGCSVGALSARLAPRCTALLGIDLSEIAVAGASARNSDQPHLTFARHHLPDEPPAGQFDLLVFSEVLYFFDAKDLRRVADWAATATAPDGDLVLVNYLGPLSDYPLSGDDAARLFIDATRAWAEPLHFAVRPHYRIDVLRRRP